MNRKNITYICLMLVLYSLVFRCTSPTGHRHAGHRHAGHRHAGQHHEEEHAHQEEAPGHDDHSGEENRVMLTDTQMEVAGVAFGTFDTLNTSGFVKANGVLDLPPQNIAAISTPMAGFIRKANFLVGGHVKKGAVLVEMEHPSYLKIQEDYLTQMSHMTYLEAEWKRQQQLSSSNINAKKRYQEVEAEYKAAQTRIKSLEQQLIYLGLNPETISNGNLSSVIYIRAPFSGYISQLNIHNGMFVQPEQELYEMIDIAHMHLELHVFEQDIHKIRVGQEIRFKVPSLGERTFAGEVFMVGKSFDPKNKMIRIHGHIQGEHTEFIRGLYLEATVYTGNEKVLALPEEAVIRDEGKNYIFVALQEAAHHEAEHTLEETPQHQEAVGHEHEEGEEHAAHHHEGEGMAFRRIEVATGISRNGQVEIKEMPELPHDARIVVQGAYDLFSELKKGEGGHHHSH